MRAQNDESGRFVEKEASSLWFTSPVKTTEPHHHENQTQILSSWLPDIAEYQTATIKLGQVVKNFNKLDGGQNAKTAFRRSVNAVLKHLQIRGEQAFPGRNT
jgi:hypothetical protein